MERENGKRGWIPKVWSGNTKWNGKLTNFTLYSISTWRLVFRYENTGMILNRMLNWSRMLQIRSHHWRCRKSVWLARLRWKEIRGGAEEGGWPDQEGDSGELRTESLISMRGRKSLTLKRMSKEESTFSWLQGIKGWRQKPAFKIWEIGNRT